MKKPTSMQKIQALHARIEELREDILKLRREARICCPTCRKQFRVEQAEARQALTWVCDDWEVMTNNYRLVCPKCRAIHQVTDFHNYHLLDIVKECFYSFKKVGTA